ncbi:hypothetical protein LTR08_005641 [Meristemomyces frigidus]|nr:hypothetical protein LTR08_005641 [Meristemomyces frigidus]
MEAVYPLEPTTGQKRGPAQSPSTEPPAAKKLKQATPVQQPRAVHSPYVSVPPPDRRPSRPLHNVADHKPLPSLPKPQPLQLPNAEYQSIAASAVLSASLARSQARWTCEGIFERYWTKPETGKNARPPPPNNPDPKWMKPKGECRIRIEPHIFDCQMWLEERPRPPPPPKQYAPSTSQSAYGQPYRPQPLQQHPPPYAPQQYHPYGPNRTAPPISQPYQQSSRTLPPINSVPHHAPPVQAPRPQQLSPVPVQQPPKVNPDPVISRLAARASSDPELKGLMKEVATGNANQDQLRIFQRHIDELQGQIKKEKELKEAEEKRVQEVEEARLQAQAQANEEMIQYDGAGDSRTSTPTPVLYAQPQHQRQYTPTQPVYPLPPQQQQPYVQPPPGPPAVILSFNTPGASEDRFLFPRNSILEKLSDYHYLASFIVIRRGRDAIDPTGLELDWEYWQPVTLMLEVQYEQERGMQQLQPEYVRKWVKPAEEVRKYMNEVMARCERAPETHLAMRLPCKVAEPDESGLSKEATPVALVEEKRKSNVKYIKKPASLLKRNQQQKVMEQATPSAAGKNLPGGGAKSTPQNGSASTPASASVAAEKEQKGAGIATATDGAADEAAAAGGGRPKRTVRKSVRISEA